MEEKTSEENVKKDMKVEPKAQPQAPPLEARVANLEGGVQQIAKVVDAMYTKLQQMEQQPAPQPIPQPQTQPQQGGMDLSQLAALAPLLGGQQDRGSAEVAGFKDLLAGRYLDLMDRVFLKQLGGGGFRVVKKKHK